MDISGSEVIMKITRTEEECAQKLETNLKFSYEHVIENRNFKMNRAKIRHDSALRLYFFGCQLKQQRQEQQRNKAIDGIDPTKY